MDIASLVRLFILAAIWGGSFLFMRIGAPVFGTGLLAELRVGIAALFLYGVCAWLGRRLNLRRHWRFYLVIGLLNSALPFLLFAYAAQTLSASLMAILNSASPIFGAIVAAIWLRQPVSRAAAVGLILGFAGVATLAWDGVAVNGAGGWLALAASLGAALSYSIASSYTKRAQAGVDPTDTAHGSMWAAALLVLPFALWIPAPQVPTSVDWLAALALGVLCTGVAYLLYFRLINDVGPVRALSVTFLIPVFGVALGVVFLDETVGWKTLAGGVLVLLGTALVNGVLGGGRALKAERS